MVVLSRLFCNVVLSGKQCGSIQGRLVRNYSKYARTVQYSTVDVGLRCLQSVIANLIAHTTTSLLKIPLLLLYTLCTVVH